MLVATETEKNISKLLAQLKANTTYGMVDIQWFGKDCQVAVSCKSYGEDWGICFQNGDMAGNFRNKAVFNNPGADSGLDDLEKILVKRQEFQVLIDFDAYSYAAEVDAIKELIKQFCVDYAKENDMDSYFQEKDEDEDEDS